MIQITVCDTVRHRVPPEKKATAQDLPGAARNTHTTSQRVTPHVCECQPPPVHIHTRQVAHPNTDVPTGQHWCMRDTSISILVHSSCLLKTLAHSSCTIAVLFACALDLSAISSPCPCLCTVRRNSHACSNLGAFIMHNPHEEYCAGPQSAVPRSSARLQDVVHSSHLELLCSLAWSRKCGGLVGSLCKAALAHAEFRGTQIDAVAVTRPLLSL